jgi:hypothetical protein
VTDPINRVDLSSLSANDKIEIEKLRAAYDRAGPKGVAEAMAIATSAGAKAPREGHLTSRKYGAESLLGGVRGRERACTVEVRISIRRQVGQIN